MGEGHRQLTEDEIAKRLAPDAPRVAVGCIKSGWVGASPREGYSRLYIGTSELSEWLEFRNEDALYQQKLESDLLPLGGSIVWFKENTKFTYELTRPRKAQAEFLDGEIRRRFLGTVDVAAPSGSFAFSTWPCIIVVSLLACTIFESCHHVAAEDGCKDPPE